MNTRFKIFSGQSPLFAAGAQTELLEEQQIRLSLETVTFKGLGRLAVSSLEKGWRLSLEAYRANEADGITVCTEEPGRRQGPPAVFRWPLPHLSGAFALWKGSSLHPWGGSALKSIVSSAIQ